MEYKTKMLYNGIDFEGDKPMQYKELRLKMAEIYKEGYYCLSQCMLIVCLMISMICQKRKIIWQKSKSNGIQGANFERNKKNNGKSEGNKAVFLKSCNIRQKKTNWYYCGGWGSANVSYLTYGIASDSVAQESHVSEQDVLDYSNSLTLSVE